MVKEDVFHLGVKALIIDRDGRVLLLQRNVKVKEKWDLPGGRVQKGERPEETLQREVYEETGLQKLHSINFVTMELTAFRIPRSSDGEVGLIFSIYQCDLMEEKPIVLSEEHVDFQWITPCKAAHLLESTYPQRVIDVLLNMKSFSTHLKEGV
tara:strand:- start:32 stop:490 length:459 start_codon:yes stop_codon:yes gene_type:complete